MTLVILDPIDGTPVVFNPENPRVRDVVIEALNAAQFQWAELTPGGGGAKPTPDQGSETPHSAPPPQARVTHKVRVKAKPSRGSRRSRCPECGELFFSRGLANHMRMHKRPPKPPSRVATGIRDSSVSCPVCALSLNSRALARHVKYRHPQEAKEASRREALNTESGVKTLRTLAFLRDIVAGRKPIPPTSLGEAMAQAARVVIPPPQS